MPLHDIPPSSRLCHAVAVLLQGHTFIATGPELEFQLFKLLGIGDDKIHLRKAALRDLLSLDLNQPDVSELNDDDAKELVERAVQYKEEVLRSVRDSMQQKYGSVHKAIASFADKHGKVREGIIALVDTSQPPGPATGTGATAWAPGLEGLELEGLAETLGVEGVLHLLAATCEEASPQPLTVVAMRLACIPLNVLSELRYRLVRKHKTFGNLVRILGNSNGGIGQAAFSAEYAQLQMQSSQPEEDQQEAREQWVKEAMMIFDFFDASGEGSLDASELQLAMSAAAPGASLERFRMCVLLKFGSWRTALSSLELSAEDLATPSALTAIAAPLDIPYEDIRVIYNRLDEDGDGELTWSELTGALITRGEGFSIYELTLRAWTACEAGKSFIEQAEARLPKGNAADMPMALEAFAMKVFGVTVNSQALQERGIRRRTVFSGQGRHSKLQQDMAAAKLKSRLAIAAVGAAKSSPQDKPLIPTQPPLSEAEVVYAFNTLWSKHNRVTMNLLLAELRAHTFVSDVLALDRGQLHPGETVAVKYRVPRNLENQLNDNPFIATVAQSMTWSSAGGGCWRLNGKEVTDFAGPRVVLPNRTAGVLQVQMPEMNFIDNEPLEFRLFSSPDGRKPGKQVGHGARFVLRQVPPHRPHVVGATVSPTSVKLLWEPPPPISQAVIPEYRSFMVRGWPLDANVAEMTPPMAAPTVAWSHRRQEFSALYSHDVRNLIPGATYRFEVSEVRRDNEQPARDRAGSASSDEIDRHTEGKEGPPSLALHVSLPVSSDPLAPGKPRFIGRAEPGTRLLKWEAQVVGGADQDDDSLHFRARASKHLLLWNVAPSGERAPQGPVVRREGHGFWVFPGDYWMRKVQSESVIECKAHLPSPIAAHTTLNECLFCVAAVADGHEVYGEPGEAVELPNQAEETLAAASETSLQSLAEAAAKFGGVNELLSAMEHAGLAGDPETVEKHIQQQNQWREMLHQAGGLSQIRRLMDLAESAGGIDRFIAALDGLDVPKVAYLAKRLQQDGQLDIVVWERVRKLVVGEEGKPDSFLQAFEALGHDKFMKLVPDLLQEHMASQNRPPEPWTAFGSERTDELLRVFRDTELNADRLLQFLRESRTNGLLGQGVDSNWRSAFLNRFQEVGGLTQFMSHFDGIDLRCMQAAADILRAGHLTSASCLPHMGSWTELVAFVEKQWGAKVGLERIKKEAKRMSHTNFNWDTFEEFMIHVNRCGGIHTVQELLSRIETAGGAEHFMAGLGDTSMGLVSELLQNLRRSGGSFQDLQKLVGCANNAGGLARVAAAVAGCSMETFIELVEELRCVQWQLQAEFQPESRRQPGEFAKVLTKVYSGMGGQPWLQAFSQYDLASLADVMPQLASAGLVRRLGQPAASPQEVALCQAFLQWVTEGGGFQRMSNAFRGIDAWRMPDYMETVRALGLGLLAKETVASVTAWVHSSVNPYGGIAELVTLSSGVDLFRLCKAWRRLAEAGGASAAVAARVGDGSPRSPMSSRRSFSPMASEGTRGSLGHRRGQDATAAIDELVNFAVTAGGSAQVMQQFSRIDGRHFGRMVDLLEAMQLSRPVPAKSGSQSSAVGSEDGSRGDRFAFSAGPSGVADVAALFKPWMHIAALAKGFGSSAIFWQKIQAVDLRHFDDCVEILQRAGLVQPLIRPFEERLTRTPEEEEAEAEVVPPDIPMWREAVVLVERVGVRDFVDVFSRITLEDVIYAGSLLQRTGLFSEVRSEGKPSEDDEVLVRRRMVAAFLQKVDGVGGFDRFWHLIRGVELAQLMEDMHCLNVIRQKLGNGTGGSSEMWNIVNDHRLLADLLEAVGTRRRADESLTPKQQVRLAQKLREIDGPDNFLEVFEGINLNVAHDQLRSLNEAGLSSPAAIAELAKLGRMVRHDPAHLRGLNGLVGTLVQWMGTYQKGSKNTMWMMLNHQVVWLLSAITQSGDMLGQFAGPAGSAAEVTPAKLAQFVNMLRPLGGVPGFLIAFQGLDLVIAAAQARALQEACVRSVESAQRLANIFGMLKADAGHLRGLEYMVRRFAVPAFVESQGGKLRALERWTLLGDTLAAAARCGPLPAMPAPPATPSSGNRAAAAAAATAGRLPSRDAGAAGGAAAAAFAAETSAPSGGRRFSSMGTGELKASGAADCEDSPVQWPGSPTSSLPRQAGRSGPEHALDVVALGLSLDEVGGLDATPADWAQLCAEIRESTRGLSGVLEALRSARTGKSICWRPKDNQRKELETVCGRCGNRFGYRTRRPQSASNVRDDSSSDTGLNLVASAGLADFVTPSLQPTRRGQAMRRPKSAGALGPYRHC